MSASRTVEATGTRRSLCDAKKPMSWQALTIAGNRQYGHGFLVVQM